MSRRDFFQKALKNLKYFKCVYTIYIIFKYVHLYLVFFYDNISDTVMKCLGADTLDASWDKMCIYIQYTTISSAVHPVRVYYET